MHFRFPRTASSWMPELFGSFGRSRPAALPDETLQLRQRSLRQDAKIARLRATIERADGRSRDLRARLNMWRHSALSHHVLRQVLPIRASRLPIAPHDVEIAASRDRSLQQASAAYRDAISGAGEATPLHLVEIDALRWWVPVNEADHEHAERVRRQGFPFRAILQTRELALGGYMLDIGANIGRTSIPRVMLGDVRAVYAAEPEPVNYACLVRNIVEHNLRGFVMPDRVAIGACGGEAHLRRSKYPGGHRVLHDSASPDRTIAVPRWTLDEWMAHLGVAADAVTFVKVDTQGSEVGVLSGASSLLARRHVSWQIEVDPGLLKKAGADITELLALVQRHFSHYIDLGSPGPGPRVHGGADLAESLAYLGTRQAKTDLLLFNAA